LDILVDVQEAIDVKIRTFARDDPEESNRSLQGLTYAADWPIATPP
jgi:hypothetical protein